MKKLCLAVIIGIIFLSSCTVKSLHPIYDEDTLISSEHVEGSWKDKDGAIYTIIPATNKKNKTKNQLIDEKEQVKSYLLDVKEDEENEKDSDFASMSLHLAKLGNTIFWDLYPKKNYQEEIQGTFTDNLIAVHTFGKIEITKDQLIVHQFRDEWLEGLFDQNKVRIAHEKIQSPDGTMIVLTASTKELQKFIVKYQNDEDAFETITFKRLSK